MTPADHISSEPHLLIGGTKSNARLREVINHLELGQDTVGEIWANDYENGISFEFEGSSLRDLRLRTVFIFVSDDAAVEATLNQDFRPFAGRLPYDLMREMGQLEVEAIMGEPVSWRKEIADSPVGFLGAAMKFELSNSAAISVEFKNDRIHRLVVMD
ncbi:MAG: hypothetical protein JXR15_01080 [Shimia sp.]|uniref:hypothetical protein n=1 Tax=Shimia sp. TaxID=1954381 RepID=UPI003B8B1202